MSITLFIATAILFTIVILLGFQRSAKFMRRWMSRTPSVILLVSVYLAYSIGTGTFRLTTALLVIAYIVGPFAFGGLAGMLWLWLPIEFGLLSSLNTVFLASLAMCTGLLAFDRIQFSLRFNGKLIRAGVGHFILYAIIAVPLGLYIGFIHFDPNLTRIVRAPLLLAAIFMFNALPEEILFRGLLQSWLERRVGNGVAALAIASVVFGAAHLNNGSPIPNYKYCLMATIAGVFYGSVWKSQRSIAASALTHSLVNATWQLFFR